MKIILLSVVSLFSFLNHAVATEMVGAISAGLGGTGRAAVETNESVFLNPAGIALFDRFYAGGGYQSGFLDRDISRNTYSIVLSDGSDSAFIPGSFAYRKHSINFAGQRFEEHEYKVGLGMRATERVSVGLSYTYLDAEGSYSNRYNQSNFDFGLLFGILPNFGLSLSGENLLKVDENKPQALMRPSRTALGAQYIYGQSLTFRYEALMPLHVENTDKLGHRVGVSATMQSNFSLSLGYSVDDLRGQNWASVGLVWRGPRLKVAYAYQNEDRAELGHRHLVDLWFDI